MLKLKSSSEVYKCQESLVEESAESMKQKSRHK